MFVISIKIPNMLKRVNNIVYIFCTIIYNSTLYIILNCSLPIRLANLQATVQIILLKTFNLESI